jgi:squalene-hopene/tetraprenyl-beta-curcumene cyclase
LATAQLTEVTDADGKAHDWKADLVSTLADQQAEDGSWTNASDRWYEGDPNLVTSYALLALAYCQPESN